MVCLKALSRYAHGEPDKYHEEFVEVVNRPFERL
jgi:hypothetical protein